jgi:hypothetical protein
VARIVFWVRFCFPFACLLVRFVLNFGFFTCMCAFFLPVFFLVQLAGGFDDIIVGLGYSAEMVKREISAGQRAELLGVPRTLNGDLTKAARSHSRRLAHASRSMARSMLDERNFMVVSCPCSPGFQLTVYGHLYQQKTWPTFSVACDQGCGAPRQT